VTASTAPAAVLDSGSVQARGLAHMYLKPVVAIAAAFVAVELAVAARYGLHRDELYFLACARHLAWGYVDQPPFVPAVARVAANMFGTSAFGLRILPAVFGGGTVVLTAATARELGGGKRAQLFAALAAATSPQVLGTFHLLSTAAFDLFFWSVITFLVVRLLRTGDERWWIAIGTVAGIGFLNKFNVAFLAVGLFVGLVATHRARMIRSGWLCAGAVIAVAIWMPNLLWNAHHDWAAVAMLRSLHQENSTIGASIGFMPAQLIVVGPVLLPFWFAGLRRLLRHQFARPLGLAYITLLILDVVSGAKPYYLGGMYFVLFAGGGLWLEERLATTRRSPRRYASWFVIGAAVAIPLTLPVLPVTSLPKGDWESNFNKDLSATVGWDHVAHQLGDIVAELPPSERAHVVVYTGDYGAAGAVDLYGKRYGLPHAISGHNSYWWWGPSNATDGATTIAVNFSRKYLTTIFSTVTPAGTVDTGHGVWTEERGAPIWICRNQKISWARAWPDARHYG
jgi:Dolichyl-phosphate-mannose-protein mannosyltransferase